MIPRVVAAVSAVVLVPAAAAAPSPKLLPRIVVSDASLARVAPELREKFAFFPSAKDAALSTPDPNDSGTDLKRLGRVAGYVRGRNAVGASSARPPKGLLSVGTSAILWRDGASAAASIKRDIADDERFQGQTLPAGRLVSVAATKLPSLGVDAALLHIHVRAKGLDEFFIQIVFRVQSIRGNALVSRTDKSNADSLALRLAKQLRQRAVTALRK
jgi:hypothetical protein